SDRDRGVEHHNLSLSGYATEQHEHGGEPSEAAHISTSYGWRQERSASAAPRTKASLAAGPSRHISSCMLTFPASVSRRRLLRASNCSNACDSSWFAAVSWRRTSSSPAAILSRTAVSS